MKSQLHLEDDLITQYIIHSGIFFASQGIRDEMGRKKINLNCRTGSTVVLALEEEENGLAELQNTRSGRKNDLWKHVLWTKRD